MGAPEKLRRDNRESCTSPSPATEHDNIKFQMLHEVAIDPELPLAGRSLIVHLITLWWNRGECFRADEAAAANIGVSVSTIQRARKHKRFLAYFEVTPGNGRAATVYRPTQAWLSAATRRRGGGVPTEERLMPPSLVDLTTPQSASVVKLTTPEPARVVKSKTQGGAFPSAQGGQNGVPIPEDESSKNPDCADGAQEFSEETGFRGKTEPSRRVEISDLPDVFLDRFLAAYPRRGKREAVEAALADAMHSGADPAKILAAARAYAVEQEGNPPRFIAYPENWLGQRRWAQHVAPTAPASEAQILENLASIVIAGKSWAASAVSTGRARQLLAAGLVTRENLRSAGVAA